MKTTDVWQAAFENRHVCGVGSFLSAPEGETHSIVVTRRRLFVPFSEWLLESEEVYRVKIVWKPPKIGESHSSKLTGNHLVTDSSLLGNRFEKLESLLVPRLLLCD